MKSEEFEAIVQAVISRIGSGSGSGGGGITSREVSRLRKELPFLIARQTGALSSFGQTNVGYVDGVLGNDATGEIGTSKPFQTIQAFIDAVPPGDDAAGARNVYVAQISPGSYDEDLAIDISRRRIILTGPGPWGLGEFNSVDWTPSNARNVVVTGDDANIDGIRPGLVITNNLPLTEAWTTHESYLTRPRISGRIDLSGVGAIGSVELGLTCEIFDDAGTGQCIEAGATIIQSYMYHCRMRTGLHGTNWNFQQAFYSRFQGLVDVSGWSLIDTCRIDTGITTVTGPSVGIFPYGMLDTHFFGTYTGPVGSAVMDGVTNYFFKLNAAVLAGGATKTIIDDLVP